MGSTLLYTIESFPPLPESINRLNELCTVDEIDLKAVISVIESDPMLYTDILRFSNVPYHGFRYPITSISQSIALFGIAAVRGMALTAALRAHPFTDVSPYGLAVNEWFRAMEQQQRFLDIWLGKKHRAMLQSLGGLTFILEIGRLVASYLLMLTEQSHSFSEKEPEKLSHEEREILGYSGDELAAKLFEFWNFEKLFVNSLLYSLTPEDGLEPKLCAALKCARTLFPLNGTVAFEEIEAILETFEFSVTDARIAYEVLLTVEE